MKGSRGRRRCASKDVGGQRGMRDKGDKAKVAGWVFESQYQEIVRNKGVHWKPGMGGTKRRVSWSKWQEREIILAAEV